MRSLEQVLELEASKDESLVWSGKPRQGWLFSAQDFFLIPLSIIWTGGVVFMLLQILATTETDQPLPLVVIPLLLVVVGIYCVLGRFIHGAFRRRHTIYGLSKKRVIIVNSSGVKSVSLNNTTEIRYKAGKAGRATIVFGRESGLIPMDMASAFRFWLGEPQAPALIQIDNGERVYAEIKRIVGL